MSHSNMINETGPSHLSPVDPLQGSSLLSLLSLALLSPLLL